MKSPIMSLSEVKSFLAEQSAEQITTPYDDRDLAVVGGLRALAVVARAYESGVRVRVRSERLRPTAELIQSELGGLT